MTDCSICLDEDANKKTYKIKECNHEFCLDCLNKMIYHKDYKCPLCRCELDDQDIFIIYELNKAYKEGKFNTLVDRIKSSSPRFNESYNYVQENLSQHNRNGYWLTPSATVAAVTRTAQRTHQRRSLVPQEYLSLTRPITYNQDSSTLARIGYSFQQRPVAQGLVDDEDGDEFPYFRGRGNNFLDFERPFLVLRGPLDDEDGDIIPDFEELTTTPPVQVQRTHQSRSLVPRETRLINTLRTEDNLTHKLLEIVKKQRDLTKKEDCKRFFININTVVLTYINHEMSRIPMSNRSSFVNTNNECINIL